MPIRVVIAGGGVAGLETLTALRALADRRVELALVAPQNEFVYRPLAIKEPFAVGRIRRIPLHGVARDANARATAAAWLWSSRPSPLASFRPARLPEDF